MEAKIKLSKQTFFLIILGALCIGVPLLTAPLFDIPLDLADFLKGLGTAFLICSIFFQRKAMLKNL